MSDWEPIPKEDSGWETIPEVSFKASPGWTLAHSLAPTGIASAVYGAREAAPELLSGDFEKALDTYRKNRDEAKKVFLESQKENPRAAMIGNIVRATPLPVLGPFGSAAYGGAEALADSSADLTRLNEEEQRKRLGRDVGSGILLGGALGGVATVAPKATAAAGIGALTGEMVSPGEGALPGAAIGLAAKRAASPAVRSYLNKKFNNILLDTPEAVTERYMANPKAVNAAPSTKGVAQRIADTFGDVRNDVGPASEQALSTLSTERVPREGFEAKNVIETLRQFNDPEAIALLQRLSGEFEAPNKLPKLMTADELGASGIKRGLEHVGEYDAGFLGKKWREKGYNYRLSDDLETRFLVKDGKVVGHIGIRPDGSIKTSYINQNLQGKGLGKEMYRALLNEGIPVSSDHPDAMEPAAKAIWESLSKEFPGQINKTKTGYHFIPKQEGKYLSEREMHEVKKVLQGTAGNWKSPLPTYKMSEARAASGDINQRLKTGNPDYEYAMDELSRVMEAKKGLGEKFGIRPDYSGQNESGFTFSDRTLSAMKDIVRGNKVDRARILQNLKEQGYGDLADEVENSLAKEALGGYGTSAGSRKAVMFGNAGMTAGAGLGGVMGGAPGAVIGGVIGKGAGALTGGVLDKYGPRVAKASMDAQSQLGAMLQNPRMQKFAQPLKTAYERGGEKSYASTYFLMNQTDEEFRQALREQDENQ